MWVILSVRACVSVSVGVAVSVVVSVEERVW